MAAPPAFAQEVQQGHDFDIPAQPLSSALELFSRQAGVQILFPYDRTAARRSDAIRGRMTAEAALLRLLAGSGLEVVTRTADRVTIRPTRRETPVPSEQAEPSMVHEDIVVTAQRYEQLSKDIPFALTAHSGETLEKLGVQTLRDMSLYTPGLLIEDQSPNNPIFVMRGITSAGGDSFTEPRVSVFQDGVPISKSRGSFVELFDIERVEVAKGPQSTLFGRGALIGGINVIQNRAEFSTDWSAAAEYGNLDYFLLDAMVNVPVGDVALRLAGRHRERGGSMDNLAPDATGDLNGVNTDAIRGTLALRPGHNFTADIFVNYQHDRTDGTGFKSMYLRSNDPETGAVLAGTGLDEGAWLQTPSDFANGRGLGVAQHYFGITGLLSYEFNDDLTISSITGWRDVNSTEVYDADGISLPLFTNMEDNGGTFLNQELRLRWDNDGPLAGSIGGNFYRERARSEVDVRFDERMLLAQVAGLLNGGPITGLPADVPAPATLFGNTGFTGTLLQGLVGQMSAGHVALGPQEGAALAARLDPAHVETGRNQSDVDAWDVFADVTLRPAPGWEVTGGVRYTTESKTTSWSSSVEARSILGGVVGAATLAASGDPASIATAQALIAGLTAFGTDLTAPLPAFGINAQPTVGNGDFIDETLDDDGFTWRLASTYSITPSTNIYGSYARGRRSAVLSAAAPGAPGAAPVFAVAPAEIVDAFEIGVKSDVRSAGLRADVSAYYYDYTNFQTRELIGSAFVTTNAGKAEAYGLEFQASWQALPVLELFGTYAYNHSRFNSGAYDGNRFARSPDHMFSAGASAEFPILAGNLFIRPTYIYRSKIFFADDNDRPELQVGRIVADVIQDEYQTGFGLLNLRVGYAPDHGLWGVEAFASNLTNEIYRKGAGSAGESIGLPTNVRGEPRVFGLRLTLRN